MTRGRKTGGRQRGTPNKVTSDVQALLAELACDPFRGMAQIAMDATNPVELRARMYAELGSYCAPKRRAIDVQAGLHDVVMTEEQQHIRAELLRFMTNPQKTEPPLALPFAADVGVSDRAGIQRLDHNGPRRPVQMWR